MELRTLGDYTLIKPLGYGALGTTFLAEQRYTKKQYVLKVLPEELAADGGFIRRFEEEVSLLAALDHPNIVKIHNVSQAQGVYFLVTDAIVNRAGESTNLAQYLLARGRRLEEEALYDLLLQIAQALDYGHSLNPQGRSLVHRGLRLNNILVHTGSEAGLKAYVSDFGLSRIVGVGAVLTQIFASTGRALVHEPISHRYPSPPVERDQQLQLHASFLQSYAFLSPEQKRIDRQDRVTRAADVYSFGVLAYFMMTGEAPEVVAPFPQVKVEEYRWNWDSLVQSCLVRNPAQRPASLTAALEALSKPSSTVSIQTESVPAEPSTSPTPVLKPVAMVRPQVDLDPARVFQTDNTVSHYTPQIAEVKEVKPILTEMVIIKEGSYYRGSNNGNRDEMPRHQVVVPNFAIDIHPVTNEQFVRFLEVMGGEKDSNHRDIIRLRDSRIKRSGGKLSIESGYQKHPVVGVTWYGAVLYAAWVGKRLPTEAEWEIAASGAGAGLTYPTGEDIEKNQANFFSADTTAVMSYPPTTLGLYDMGGNVYEWCYDWYAYNYYEVSVQEPENPKGPLQGVYRVLRGGCWKSLKEDLRSSRRHRNNPGTVNGTYGFRCAADVS